MVVSIAISAVILLNYPELLNCLQSPQFITLGSRVFIWESVRSDTENKIEEILCPQYAEKKTTKHFMSGADRFPMNSRTTGK